MSFEDKYRKKSTVGQPVTESEAPSPALPAGGAIEVLKDAAKEEYKAFNASAHPETDIWVRVSAGNSNADVAIPYSYRNQLIYDGDGFLISMHFNTPVVSVTLHGRKLHDLFRKLLKREVEWVMEFDAEKWAPLDDSEPCITLIEIKRGPLPEKKTDDDAVSGHVKPDKAAMH
jgi:hypothetical protein